jgi:pimeloyl-ACP methyl ester carboxylesterase
MTRESVLVDGNQLAVWRAGSGAPIAFVHGWLCDHQDMVDLAAELAPDHETILLDLRGHGESEAVNGPFGMADFAADVIGVIRALDVGPALLVGHSMGAAVVLEAVRLAPELVRGVLLVDSRWAFTSPTEEQLASIPTLRGESYFPRRAAMDRLRRQVLPDVEIGAPTQAVAAESYAGLLTWPGQVTLRECPVPVHAVVADQHWPLIDAAKQAMPSLSVELIAGTGHWVHVERPQRVAESVRHFEDGLD